MTTLAPGIGNPASSKTVPEIVDCATTTVETSINKAEKNLLSLINFSISLLLIIVNFWLT